MKQCSSPDCQNMIEEKYNYCFQHFRGGTNRTQTPTTKTLPPGQWHDDSTVDQLMKINANLGKIAQELALMNAAQVRDFGDDPEPQEDES